MHCWVGGIIVHKKILAFIIVCLILLSVSTHTDRIEAQIISSNNSSEQVVHSQIRVLSVQITPITHRKFVPVHECSQQDDPPRYGCGYSQNPDGTWPIDIDESGGANRYPFVSNPVSLDIESEYLPNVVPIESSPDNGFGSSALKAQAVAARTYSYYHIESSAPGDLYDAENHTGYQYYQANAKYALRASSYPQSDAAIAATRNVYLVAAAAPNNAEFTEFSADHSPQQCTGEPCDYYTMSGGSLFLKKIYDPITNGEERPIGHGRGMSQQGARKWGDGRDTNGTPFPTWDYTKILAHYYSGAQMRIGNGPVIWGAYRWNMLQYAPTNTTFFIDEAKNINLTIQNTGVNQWEAGTELYYRWKRTPKAAGNGTAANGTWQKAMSGSSATVIPRLNPGDSNQLPSIAVAIQIALSDYNTSLYNYQIDWDLRRPNNQYMGVPGNWQTQEWTITLKKRVAAPAPVAPPCPRNTVCPQNTGSINVAWGSVAHPNPVTYRWTHYKPNGQIESLTTTGTQINIALVPGQNDVYVKAFESSDTSNSSAEILVANALYDPHPPFFSALTALPQWSNAQTLNIAWQGIDTLSGVDSYKLEQQINGGVWTTLVANTQATQYTTPPLANNTAYTLRVTIKDKAGNTTAQTLGTTIDRDPPTSTITRPIPGQLGKTWTIVEWSKSYQGAPITAYVIELQNGDGTWNIIRTSTGPFMLFEGEPYTFYGLRVSAMDAAGNAEPRGKAEVSFQTGGSSTGLGKLWLNPIHTPGNLPGKAAPPYPLPGSP